MSKKATGIIRHVDSLGRVVIPKEIRRQLNITDNEDSLEIFMEGDKIVLKKYNPGCVICGELSDITTYKGHNFCSYCAKKIGELK